MTGINTNVTRLVSFVKQMNQPPPKLMKFWIVAGWFGISAVGKED